MDLERFIPFSKADVLEMCIQDGRLDAEQSESFRGFSQILTSLFHFEFHEKLEQLKKAYAPYDPNRDVRRIKELTEAERKTELKRLVAGMSEVLEAANYERITQEDLHAAMKEESLFNISLQVDFDDFEEVLFFRRGETLQRKVLKKFFGLKKVPLEYTNYDRVAIYFKFKDEAYFKAQKRKNLMFKPGSTIIKLFEDVPKADLEMLFPNTQVRMKLFDKLVLGVPAFIGGVVMLATKLMVTLSFAGSVLAFYLGFSDKPEPLEPQVLVAMGSGLAAFGGFLFRQLGKFKNRKILFMKVLSENLYFKNLDNNAGVFHHLLDAAEEEECKEALLGYFFLLTTETELTEKALDDVVEGWFKLKWDADLDFEVDDALGKLERLGLVHREGDILRVKPLDEAKAHLDKIWDNYFTYNEDG